MFTLKKIIQVGTSMGIYIPKEFSKAGYTVGTEVSISLEENNIVIRPKHLYQSRIKDIIEKAGVFIPSFKIKDENKSSVRFEDLKTFTRGKEVISFVRDHLHDKLFMYYLEVTEEKKIAGLIIGTYISDKAMEEIIGGKSVQHYLP